MIVEQRLSEAGGAIERRSVGKFTRGINRRAIVFVAPFADSVEIFERESDRVHDFVAAAVQWKPLPHELLDLFGIDAVRAETVPLLIQASPVIYISKEMPPFLLMHGSKDEDVPYEQSIEMCEKMKKAGAHCDLITIDGAPHGMDHWESHPEWLWYKKALVDWLEKTLR